MSERRTAEIKFRCTPSFKASLAAAAEAADQSLTEYIESAVEAYRTAAPSAVGTRADALDVSDLRALLEAGCCAGHPVNADTACTDCPLVPTVRSEYGGPDAPALSAAVPPQTKCAGNCRPWEFCHCKAEA